MLTSLLVSSHRFDTEEMSCEFDNFESVCPASLLSRQLGVGGIEESGASATNWSSRWRNDVSGMTYGMTPEQVAEQITALVNECRRTIGLWMQSARMASDVGSSDDLFN